MIRHIFGILRNVATPPSILGALITLSFFTSLARADQLEWTQKAGGAGATISASGPYNASDASSNRLHSAVLQSSTVLQATDGGTWRLNSGYLTTFPSRPLVQCRNNANTANCTTWQNDAALNWRNDRGCTSNCAFSKGALHYYKYVWSANASETSATVDAGSKWSDTAAYCPGGACAKTGTTVNQAVTESTGWYLHLISYNGGLKGGQVAYGPFGIDQTIPNTPTWSGPTAGDWYRAAFDINISNDSDPGAVQSGVPASGCDVAVLSNAVYTVNDAIWTTTGNRTCNSTSSYNATVGAASNCRDRGLNKCEIRVRARDAAGNVSGVASRTFSADWNITDINNSVTSNVKGYPVSASNSGGFYIGTYVSGTDTVYLLDSTATIIDSKVLGSGGSIVGQFWELIGTSNFLWVVTDNGKLYKIENVDSGTPNDNDPTGNKLCDPGETIPCTHSGAVWKQLNSAACGGATNATITTPPTPFTDAVWFAGKDIDCVTTERLYAVETSTNSVSANGLVDIVVDEPACAENQVTSQPKVVRGTDWTTTYAHFGTDCDGAANNVKLIRIDADNPAGTCTKDVLGTNVPAWMTGTAGYLYLGTVDTVVPSASERGFYMLSGSEDAACGTVYATVAGFPSQDLENPAGADIGDVSRGAKVNFLSTQDEAYFVTDDGKLHCVCTKTTTDASTCVIAAANQCDGSPGVGQSCTGFPVAFAGETQLGEPLLTDGVLYVVANSGRVYAIESLCDPTADDSINPGTFKTTDGYSSTAAATFNLGVAISSTAALMNNGTKKVALGTDSGKVFYLPVTP